MPAIAISLDAQKVKTGQSFLEAFLEQLCQSAISNRTLIWVLSCKFAAYFQNTFLYEHLWRAASGTDLEVKSRQKRGNF